MHTESLHVAGWWPYPSAHAVMALIPRWLYYCICNVMTFVPIMSKVVHMHRDREPGCSCLDVLNLNLNYTVLLVLPIIVLNFCS